MFCVLTAWTGRPLPNPGRALQLKAPAGKSSSPARQASAFGNGLGRQSKSLIEIRLSDPPRQLREHGGPTADKGYHADAIRNDLADRLEAVIPGRSNRRAKIEHDRILYRHIRGP